MAGAIVGSLRVDLGLNSAAFTQGLNLAQGKLKSFQKITTMGFAALGVAAAGAAAAIGIGIKGALDHADALGKSAQKAGVAVESLSRLEYAAKLSDVSLESLTGGLQKLSKSMVDVAGGKGPEAAFRALGIAVKDGLGNLRSGDAVFADLADRFSRMEDSALKTSLAVQIFGKSGAELIPLLNEGRDGLAAMAAESDRLGNTISTSTAKAAEKFNDTLTTIQASLQGVFNRIIGDQGVQTAIQDLADTLASPEFAASMTQFAQLVIEAINTIAWAAIQAKKAIDALTPGNGITVRQPGESDADFMTRLGRNPNGSRKLQSDGTPMPTSPVLGDFLNGSFFSLGGAQTFGSTDSLWASLGGKGGSKGGSGSGNAGLLESLNATTDALEPLDLGLQDVEDSVASLADTITSTLADSLATVAEAFLTGKDAAAAFASVATDLGKQLLSSGLKLFFNSILGGGLTSPWSKGPSGFAPGGGLWPSTSLFASGGISNVPAIFGESGPEAAVPLPDGRRIPVELRGANGGGETVVRLELSPMLTAQILKEAANQSVQIVKSQAPAAVASAQRNKTL